MPGLGAAATASTSASSLPGASEKRRTAKWRLGRSKPRITCAGSRHAEALDDLAADRRRGGRGQGEDGGAAEPLGEGAQLQVVGAEVVAPLADAVGLVDDEAARVRWRAGRPAPRGLASCSGASRTNSCSPRSSAAISSRRCFGETVEFSSAASPGEMCSSIASTWSRCRAISGRDDDRRPAEQLAGQLVDRRLAVAGRHHRQRVAAGEDRFDRLQLPLVELLDPELLLRQPLDSEFSHAATVPPTPARLSRYARQACRVERSFPDGAGGRNGAIWPKSGQMIEAARTLMKSEPELAELIAEVEGVEVTMAEKGFGTRVQLRAAEQRPRTGGPRGGSRPTRRTAAPPVRLTPGPARPRGALLHPNFHQGDTEGRLGGPFCFASP